MQVTVIFTCFNRKEKSVKCIESLIRGNEDFDLRFIVVDDNSTDGTKEVIQKMNCNIDVLTGNGTLFWAGGMRKGIDAYLTAAVKSEYVLLVNDDVQFFEGIINKLIVQSKNNNNAVIVGATCDAQGEFTYGAMRLVLPRRQKLYEQIKPSLNKVACDTFNCNCVLIKSEIIETVGNFDEMYLHSLADLDYGLRMRKMGYYIYSSEDYVGVCEKNDNKGTWTDSTLTRRERLKLKESPKGAPAKQWFYFVKQHFGLFEAIMRVTVPYLRILMKK